MVINIHDRYTVQLWLGAKPPHPVTGIAIDGDDQIMIVAECGDDRPSLGQERPSGRHRTIAGQNMGNIERPQKPSHSKQGTDSISIRVNMADDQHMSPLLNNSSACLSTTRPCRLRQGHHSDASSGEPSSAIWRSKRSMCSPSLRELSKLNSRSGM